MGTFPAGPRRISRRRGRPVFIGWVLILAVAAVSGVARAAPEPSGSGLPAWAAAGLALSLAGFGVDAPMAAEIRSLSGNGAWADEVSLLGDGAVALGLSGTLALVDPETGRRAADAVVTAGAAALLLKWATGVPRPGAPGEHRLHPFEVPLLSAEGAWPSGHTAVAFALARVLADRYPRRASLFYLAALLVGISRVAGGYHWPSDVIAGGIVGFWAGERALNGQGALALWRF